MPIRGLPFYADKGGSMKLEDMVMVVENHKGTETNFLLDLTDYMGEVMVM